MSKLKRLRRKRALRREANIRQMAQQRGSKVVLGSNKLLKRMTRDHQDLLQNIEFTLVSGYRDDSSIDDRIVAEALTAAIRGDAPEETRRISLCEGLEDVREFRSDVSDEVWRAGLQTVLQSVHRHSTLKPGSRDYLDFVSDFIL